MKRLVWGVCLIALAASTRLYAQAATGNEATVNDLKAKIFDATMLRQTFVNGLRFCNELDGTNFYFEPRNRVLKLDEFHRSLENLAREGVFNPEKRRPWSEQDATERWKQVEQEAARDKANCDLVNNLPVYQKQLDDLQKKTGTSQK